MADRLYYVVRATWPDGHEMSDICNDKDRALTSLALIAEWIQIDGCAWKRARVEAFTTHCALGCKPGETLFGPRL